MYNKLLFTFLCAFLLLQCTTTSDDPITNEIMSLTTNIDKRMYLEKIYNDNKGLSKNLPVGIEEINIKKIGTYLELFGHPKKADLGPMAAQTPWIIIHDNKAADRLEVRTKYFPIFFKAFLNGDINDGQMTMFLNRSYEYKFGEKYKDKDAYGSKNEINTLIGLLNLETSMN